MILDLLQDNVHVLWSSLFFLSVLVNSMTDSGIMGREVFLWWSFCNWVSYVYLPSWSFYDLTYIYRSQVILLYVTGCFVLVSSIIFNKPSYVASYVWFMVSARTECTSCEFLSYWMMYLVRGKGHQFELSSLSQETQKNIIIGLFSLRDSPLTYGMRFFLPRIW